MIIALGQIDIIWEDEEKNKEKVKKFTEKAKILVSDMIFFSEMSSTSFLMNVKKLASDDALE
ncbi:MAG: hypothetical protein J7K87_03840 [Candidatus Aenigmarchaeota archaeon]|nr:hypothetical protein [Candidatus Aenigmarchaeota archaeon]